MGVLAGMSFEDVIAGAILSIALVLSPRLFGCRGCDAVKM